MKNLQLIPNEYFDIYLRNQKLTLQKHFDRIQRKDHNKKTFDLYMTISAVYSSNIEGNEIDLSSFIKYTQINVNKKTKSYKQIEDLINAYEFAKSNTLCLSNLLAAHDLLSKTLIDDFLHRGKLRSKKVMVINNNTGEVVYNAASPAIVKTEMNKLFDDIELLINKKLSIDQVFYFASMIHLVFVNIHPFVDGNGRTARLIEKWFLASKLNQDAWFIKSEQLYFRRLKSYYKNIQTGRTYETIDYNRSIPFLLMLPMALRLK